MVAVCSMPQQLLPIDCYVFFFAISFRLFCCVLSIFTVFMVYIYIFCAVEQCMSLYILRVYDENLWIRLCVYILRCVRMCQKDYPDGIFITRTFIY